MRFLGDSRVWLIGLRDRLAKSYFFMISLALHVVVLSFLLTHWWNLWHLLPPGFVTQKIPTTTQEPRVAANIVPLRDFHFAVTTPDTMPTLMSMGMIATTSPLQASYAVLDVAAPVVPLRELQRLKMEPSATPVLWNGIPKNEAEKIADFTKVWNAGNDRVTGNDLRKQKFRFTAYVARYKGGDWNAQVTKLVNDRIVRGALPNLLYFIKNFSGNRIDASLQAKPLDLSSNEIFKTHPPFIFFTGHEDFRLTEPEVENLRKYIQLGGCIWGDSALPGRYSRFDIAFRREMLRVMPEPDAKFEPLMANNSLFQSGYFPEIRRQPRGLNYFQEPVYVIKRFGQIAVIYTANGYGDMWQFGLSNQLRIDLTRDQVTHQMIFTDQTMWNQRDLFFRNVNDESVAACYKFGVNMILHLLTRWESQTGGLPRAEDHG